MNEEERHEMMRSNYAMQLEMLGYSPDGNPLPKHPPKEDRCVMCGEIIPEGSQVCPNCHAKAYAKLPDRWLMRDVPMRPKVYKTRLGYSYTCRQCGRTVSRAEHKYCPKCGQCQDWDAVWLHEKEILNGRDAE